MNRYERTIQMLNDGYSVEEISRELKQSRSTTYRYINIDRNEKESSFTVERHDPKELERFVKRGMRTSQIAKIYGVTNCTVSNWCRRDGIPTPTQWKEQRLQGFNADRHLCKTCNYRMKDKLMKSRGARCDYIGVTGESRKCDVCICDKYVLEKRRKRKSKKSGEITENGEECKNDRTGNE